MDATRLTSEAILRYIPNVMAHVEGERTLADKLAPFIDSAKVWIESEFLGSDDFLSEKHNDFALKILVTKAFADAVPALDLVVTPSGMAVIRTDSMTPASKERVERLVSSLHGYVRANIGLLVDICKTYPAWRKSERGRYFCSTFISLFDCDDFLTTIHGTFDIMRQKCIAIENAMKERYLGKLLDVIRQDYHQGKIMAGCYLVSSIRSAISAILKKADGEGLMVFSDDLLWRVCRPIVNELNYYPEYKTAWDAEMGDRFNTPGFVNNIKGGFYF